jgi:hypothetical protein
LISSYLREGGGGGYTVEASPTLSDSYFALAHFTGDIVDSDPLAEYEVTPDQTYADTDPEAGVLPPE